MSRQVSGTELKYLRSNVLALLTIAEKHNGVLYGGVRDFPVITVKDVHIWFSTEKDRASFIENTSDILALLGESANSIKYSLVDKFDDRLIYVNLVVDPDLRVTNKITSHSMYSLASVSIPINRGVKSREIRTVQATQEPLISITDTPGNKCGICTNIK